MNMESTITITSKGQTTIPVAIRRKLGVGKAGDVLRVRFNDRRGELIISKPPSIAELSERISSYIKPGTKPLLNVDEYYQKHRKVRS
ncbi:MAG: AbrB/MazE/SpoVT family DNA-binding domain-containing protein [Candidatus Dormibacteraceae bacterium]